MKFLCLAYPGRGCSPGPDLVAEYAAPGEAMRAAGVFVDSGQLSPATPPRSSGSRTGEPTSATARSRAADRSPAPTSPATAQTSTPRLAARIPAASDGTLEVRPPR